jgi:hypothetical protein
MIDEAQKQKVASWIAEGLKLSEIQSRLATELGVRLSYLEVRLLIDDLKLKPKDVERAKATPMVAAPDKGAAPPRGEPAAERNTESAEHRSDAGGISVTVDHVARPGALVSGKVTFSDSKDADWYLDQFGRLAVIPKEQGYKPTHADVLAFQAELERHMAKLGAF